MDLASARRRLLFRRKRPGDGDVPEGPRELGGVESSAGAGPVLGGELDVPLAGPVGHHADDVCEVGLGVELVQLAGGHEREEVRGGAGVVVAAAEEPILAADGDRAQRALGAIV
jgi:hypothetical protein